MTHFYNYLKSFGDKTINVYIDMDGVVADYDFEGYKINGTDTDVYLKKRPVLSSIKPLEKVSSLENVNLYILSVARYERQIPGKLEWLDKNMSFIKKENINIIPRDTNNFTKAKELKKEFLDEHVRADEINIHIDDSHEVMDMINSVDNLIVLHVTSIQD